MAALMNFARWVFFDHLDGTVILGALLAAWLVQRAELRMMRGYDAWWFFHLPGAHRRLRR